MYKARVLLEDGTEFRYDNITDFDQEQENSEDYLVLFTEDSEDDIVRKIYVNKNKILSADFVLPKDYNNAIPSSRNDTNWWDEVKNEKE